MNSQIVGLRVASVVFGVMSAAQFVRLLAQAEVLVAGHSVPLWASGVAFAVAAGLCAWMCRLSYRGTK